MDRDQRHTRDQKTHECNAEDILVWSAFPVLLAGSLIDSPSPPPPAVVRFESILRIMGDSVPAVNIAERHFVPFYFSPKKTLVAIGPPHFPITISSMRNIEGQVTCSHPSIYENSQAEWAVMRWTTGLFLSRLATRPPSRELQMRRASRKYMIIAYTGRHLGS